MAACLQDAKLFITAPQKMEALHGSCLQIPCNFSAPGQETFDRGPIGVWMKSDLRFDKFPHNVIFNSSVTPNIYPMNIIGDLSKKNCTTVFSNLTTTYTDTYFFRIQIPDFKASAPCDPLQIEVKSK